MVQSLKPAYRIAAGALVLFSTAIFLSDAHAAGTTDFGGLGETLCSIVQAITGNVGRAVATIAIVFLGIGAFFGKVTWGLAVAVGIGIFAIFGTSKILNAFGAGACTNTGN